VRAGPRKDSLVAAICDYLLSDALSGARGQLSEIERQAVAEAVHNWSGVYRAVAFEAKYGSQPSFFTRDPLPLLTYSYAKPNSRAC
jgi:hypothetical protein